MNELPTVGSWPSLMVPSSPDAEGRSELLYKRPLCPGLGDYGVLASVKSRLHLAGEALAVEDAGHSGAVAPGVRAVVWP